MHSVAAFTRPQWLKKMILMKGFALKKRLAKIRKHASWVHFAKIHFGKKNFEKMTWDPSDFIVFVLLNFDPSP